MTENTASASSSASASRKAAADGRRLEARYAGKTVLAVGAHPDDLELGVGGTLAKLAKSARVVMCVVCVPNRLEVRLAEAARAAAILGGELRVLVPGACRRVEDLKTYELVGLLEEQAKTFRPAAVITHGTSDFHTDHTLVHAACEAAEGFMDGDVLCYSPTATRPTTVPFAPHVFVDISESIEVKMDAIAAHGSQFAERGLPIESFREQARECGRGLGFEYAEALEVGRMILR